MAKIVDDLKGLIHQLRELNDDASDETSKTVGKASQKVRDTLNALEAKIAEVIRRKMAGEKLEQDPPDDVTEA